MNVYPKYQVCPDCKKQGRIERVPTIWELDGDEVELPGMHRCVKGHLFLTRLTAEPGEETIVVGSSQ